MSGKAFSLLVETVRDFCEKLFPSGLTKILRNSTDSFELALILSN